LLRAVCEPTLVPVFDTKLHILHLLDEDLPLIAPVKDHHLCKQGLQGEKLCTWKREGFFQTQTSYAMTLLFFDSPVCSGTSLR
jgi:hypothetical protein